MKISIFGVGGVGGYFGGRLAMSGNDVTFIARGNHLENIKRNGLRVDSINGDFVIPKAQATNDPSSIGHVDLVLVAVKAWQVPDAASAIKPMIGAHTTVLPLLNGVEAVPQLAAEIGNERIVGGLCKLISSIVGPGHIKHAGVVPYVALGELDGSESARVDGIYDAFISAGVTVEKSESIQTAIWEKFLFIAAWSGVGAVTRVPVGMIRENNSTRNLLISSMQEIASVALSQGVGLLDDVVEKTMNYLDSLPYEGTASMQRDIEEGRPSELESQTGAVVRLGKQHEVATPVNSFIYSLLSLKEQIARTKTA
jgi:2-dehydropantoate 2-reductase